MNMLDTICFKFSIIIITETWLNTNNINLLNINDYNSIHTISKMVEEVECLFIYLII